MLCSLLAGEARASCTRTASLRSWHVYQWSPPIQPCVLLSATGEHHFGTMKSVVSHSPGRISTHHSASQARGVFDTLYISRESTCCTGRGLQNRMSQHAARTAYSAEPGGNLACKKAWHIPPGTGCPARSNF